MNIDYYAELTAHILNEYQRAKTIPSGRMKNCTKKANAVLKKTGDQIQARRAYKNCMKAAGAGHDPTDTAGEILK